MKGNTSMADYLIDVTRTYNEEQNTRQLMYRKVLRRQRKVYFFCTVLENKWKMFQKQGSVLEPPSFP